MAREASRRVDEQILVQDLTTFDYAAAAELFSGASRNGNRRNKGFTYNRFDSAAEALRFAIEEAPAQAILGVYLEVNEARFDLNQIRLLYANARYPLQRRTMPATESTACGASR